MLIMATFDAILADDHDFGYQLGFSLLFNPSTWLLLATTLLIIYPWLHMRKRNYEVEELSSHAVRLCFDYRKVSTYLFCCSQRL